MADFFVIWLEVLLNTCRFIWTFLSNSWQGVVALAALFLSLYEYRHQKEHNRISLKPNLYTFVNDDLFTDSNRLVHAQVQVELINSGLGPAHIKCYEVYYDGKIIDGDDKGDAVAVFLSDLLKDFTIIRKQSAVLGSKAALVAGERRTILDIRVISKENDDLQKLKTLLSKLSLKINYESCYGELFEFDTNQL